MNELSNLNDVLLSPLGLAPLICAALGVALLPLVVCMQVIAPRRTLPPHEPEDPRVS